MNVEETLFNPVQSPKSMVLGGGVIRVSGNSGRKGMGAEARRQNQPHT